MHRTQLKYPSHQYTTLLYACFIGFVIGVLVTNLWTDASLLHTGLLSQSTIDRILYLEVDSNKLLCYVVKNRMQLFITIAILTSTILGPLCCYLFSGWFGLTTGIILSSLTIRFGMKGSFLFLACMLPHMICYVYGFYRLLRESCYLSYKLYFPDKISIDNLIDKHQNLNHIGRITTATGVVIIGIFLESYVNPQIVAWIVTILKIL
ncbi:MAG: stage II sporulation protein M [Lachnospiraceae bacterium]